MTASGPSLSDSPDAAPRADVIVVGGGISGLACARALDARGVPVRVLERSGRVGGRLSSPPLPRDGDDARPVDMGAAYFTVSDDEFGEQVADWERRGPARHARRRPQAPPAARPNRLGGGRPRGG